MRDREAPTPAPWVGTQADWGGFWWAGPRLTKEHSSRFPFFRSNNAVVNLCGFVFFVVFPFWGVISANKFSRVRFLGQAGLQRGWTARYWYQQEGPEEQHLNVCT